MTKNAQGTYELPEAHINEITTLNLGASYDVPAGETEVVGGPNDHATRDFSWTKNTAINSNLAPLAGRDSTLTMFSPVAAELLITVTVKVKWWPGTGENRWEGTASATFKQSVTQKKWDTGLLIGQSKDAQGLVVEGARMTAPQDQTPANKDLWEKVWVLPGSVVNCEVQTATDSDAWNWTRQDGTATTGDVEADTIDDPRDYQWSGADFITAEQHNPDGTTTYSTAPTFEGKTARALAPASGSFAPKCTISNNSGKTIGINELGERKDAVVERTSSVAVTTATAALEVRHITAAATTELPEQSEAKAIIGGNSNYAVLTLSIGGGLKVKNASAMLRLREEADAAHGVTHSFGSNHVDRAISFTGGAWEKWYDPDLVLNPDGSKNRKEDGTENNGPKPLDWWPSPEAPSNAATKNGGQSYRIKIPWTTTGPQTSNETVNGVSTTNTLLGHNGAHTAFLVKVDDVASKTIKFELKAGGVWTDVAEDQSATVGNVTVEDVTTNSNSPYFFKFESNGADATQAQPTVSFKIVDAGDPHRYAWKVRIRSTDSESWDGVLIKGEADAGATVTAKVNDPDAIGQEQTDNAESGSYQALSETGTYTFDISVREIDLWGNDVGDSQSYRSIKLYLPYTMPGVANTKGHDGEMVTDAGGTERYKVSYYLRDDSGVAGGTNASKLFIKMLPPGMGDEGPSSDATWTTTLNTPVLGKLLETFAPEPRLVGMYITVFTAEDTHKDDYRDHKNRPTLTKNDRKSDTPELINTPPQTGEDWSRNGDRVVSAKDDVLGLPGGEKVLHLKIWPPRAKVTLTIKRKVDGGASGSAVFANPTTKAVIGSTINLTGEVENNDPKEAKEQSLLILGRDISSKARNLYIELKNDKGDVKEATFAGQEKDIDAAGKVTKRPWDFTVFQVNIQMFTSGHVDDLLPDGQNKILPDSVLAYAGLGDRGIPETPNTLKNFYDKFSVANGKLGNGVSEGGMYGGIVMRGQIIPTNIKTTDFNQQHSRKFAFMWYQEVSSRTYNSFGCFKELANQPYFGNKDKEVDMADDGSSDLVAGRDLLNDDHLYLWFIDAPSIYSSAIGDGEEISKRDNFIDQIEYGNRPVSAEVKWYWRASALSQDGALVNTGEAEDNKLGIGATSLAFVPGVDYPTPTIISNWPTEIVLPLQNGVVVGGVGGSSLSDAAQCGKPFIYLQKIEISERNTKKDTYFLQDSVINQTKTQVTGSYSLPASAAKGGYVLKVFVGDKVASKPNATVVR